mmetsp:Transcript_25652/g.82855  ORF Transcript_25652/g.82855 Transcript_25652/m.82855 type:complete len:247 (-) Transcript_25652:1476-2216(-)
MRLPTVREPCTLATALRCSSVALASSVMSTACSLIWWTKLRISASSLAVSSSEKGSLMHMKWYSPLAALVASPEISSNDLPSVPVPCSSRTTLNRRLILSSTSASLSASLFTFSMWDCAAPKLTSSWYHSLACSSRYLMMRPSASTAATLACSSVRPLFTSASLTCSRTLVAMLITARFRLSITCSSVSVSRLMEARTEITEKVWWPRAGRTSYTSKRVRAGNTHSFSCGYWEKPERSAVRFSADC